MRIRLLSGLGLVDSISLIFNLAEHFLWYILTQFGERSTEAVQAFDVNLTCPTCFYNISHEMYTNYEMKIIIILFPNLQKLH